MQTQVPSAQPAPSLEHPTVTLLQIQKWLFVSAHQVNIRLILLSWGKHYCLTPPMSLPKHISLVPVLLVLLCTVHHKVLGRVFLKLKFNLSHSQQVFAANEKAKTL